MQSLASRHAATAWRSRRRAPGHRAPPEGQARHQRRATSSSSSTATRRPRRSTTSCSTCRPALRRHGLPPRDRPLHDPGRRHDRRHEGEADPRADRTESQNGLTNERARSPWRARRPELGHRAVLHQRARQRQFLDPPSTTATATRCSARSSRGMDVVDKIKACRPATAACTRRAATPVVIKKATMEKSPTNPRSNCTSTSQGTITLELDEQKAPKTVANFLDYVKKGHYDGTVFHRVIEGFMVQGGGFEPGMKQKPTDAPIENEANNGLKNDRVHRRHGAHLGAALGDGAVLHQRRRQRLPEPQVAHAPGLGLRGVRQGGRRPGRRRQHQGRGHRQPRRPRRRAEGRTS